MRVFSLAYAVSSSSLHFSKENYTFYIYCVKCLLILMLDALQSQWISHGQSIHFALECFFPFTKILPIFLRFVRLARLRHHWADVWAANETCHEYIWIVKCLWCVGAPLISANSNPNLRREFHFYGSLSNIFTFTFFAASDATECGNFASIYLHRKCCNSRLLRAHSVRG